ncbi:MAG: efflux RND transporter periplasmic adaptor subunit [Acidobacteriota bacterium]|nr:efflux RND transporter periplasmic adaptor subunit [Acidobacteriota bacterium]MDH3525125.1 efflux RND transporter periplasmic adaptor subunit [Acidobacteriota bacterium]
MKRILKILVVLLVVAAAGGGGYAWLKGRRASGEELKLVKVERGSIVEKAVAIGQIEPRLEFKVKSKIPGIVKTCVVDVGDAVRAGDALFEIVPDPTPTELVEAQRRLDAAQSAYTRAESGWSRAQELAREGITPADELDSKREGFELAAIELASAQDNLELVQKGRIAGRGRSMESIIRAPAAGIVLARNIDPGDPVVPLTSFQEGTELATIADMTDLIFRGTVDEIDVGKLAPGVEARLKIGALPDSLVTGRLTRIAPQAVEEEGARLFEVEIELDPAQAVVLRAGYSANADLVIREKQDILLIPERLVLFEDDGAKTFVEIPGAGPESEPEKIEIESGLSDGLNIEVLSGLEEGDEVVQRPPRDVLG